MREGRYMRYMREIREGRERGHDIIIISKIK